MSTRRLVIWITFLAIFAMVLRISIDTDTWWHLRAGQWIVENRAVPRVDAFSYTRFGAAWEYPGWLVEVPMYAIYATGGAGGLNLWTAIMVVLAFAFIYPALSGGPFLRAFVLVLAAAVSAVYWAARPYLVTFVFTAIFIWVLEAHRWTGEGRSSRRLWLLPVLMVIWANSHGGFAVGFLLWGAYFAAEALRLAGERLAAMAGRLAAPAIVSRRVVTLGLIGLALVLAVCINPHGARLLAYPFETVHIGALRQYVQEWQSPDFHSLSVQPFVWLLLLLLGAVGTSRKRLALVDFLLVAGFAYMGLLAGRNLALFALVAPPVLTRHAAPPFHGWERCLGLRRAREAAVPAWQRWVNPAIILLLALPIAYKASLVLPDEANRAAMATTLPVAAVELIERERPAGRLFNSYNWGGYLIWELPAYPVFIDGRTDLYNGEVIDEWVRIVQAEAGWEEALDGWDINLVLLEPYRPVVRLLQDAGWEVLHQDDISILLSRQQ
ncbi:MAG: hypothetical protein PHS96_14095 [Anaerolineales bacterium]|nr:hypothetical protein [Anaerolineales bacterium]